MLSLFHSIYLISYFHPQFKESPYKLLLEYFWEEKNILRFFRKFFNFQSQQTMLIFYFGFVLVGDFYNKSILFDFVKQVHLHTYYIIVYLENYIGQNKMPSYFMCGRSNYSNKKFNHLCLELRGALLIEEFISRI